MEALLKIEEEGGFYASILKGTIQGTLKRLCEKQTYNALATQDSFILGITNILTYRENG